jgi:hypothetical protein
MTLHKCRCCGKKKDWDLVDTLYERICPECFKNRPFAKCRKCGGPLDPNYVIPIEIGNKAQKKKGGQKVGPQKNFKYCEICRPDLYTVKKDA